MRPRPMSLAPALRCVVMTRLRITVRALVRGALRSQASRGATFAALRAAGMRTHDRRDEQRARDRVTLRYFTAIVVREYGLDPAI